jgi:cell shape-determining protein MreD
MSAFQWVIAYLCIATLVAGGAVMFATWSRKTHQSMRAVILPALLAGALWPLVAAGVAQWLLMHALAHTLRRRRERASEAVYYGPPHRPTVNAA